MDDEITRAWRYHEAADNLLHSRIESMLIVQAFLTIGYAQVLVAQDFCKRNDLKYSLLLIVILGLILTVLMIFVCRGLSRGLRFLKENYLAHQLKGDPVYIQYLRRLRGDSTYDRRAFPRIWSFWLAFVFLIFWIVAAGHAGAFSIGYLRCS